MSVRTEILSLIGSVDVMTLVSGERTGFKLPHGIPKFFVRGQPRRRSGLGLFIATCTEGMFRANQTVTAPISKSPVVASLRRVILLFVRATEGALRIPRVQHWQLEMSLELVWSMRGLLTGRSRAKQPNKR